LIPTPRPRSRTYSSASRDSRPQLDIHQRQRRLFALKRRNGERRLCPTWIAYRTGFDRLPHVLGFDLKGYLVGASSLFNGNELRPVFHLHAGHKPKSGHVSSGSFASDQDSPDLARMSALPPITTKLVRRNEVTLCARSGCEQPQQIAQLFDHSITRSAPASSIFGITMPRAFAALRLITSSNFVGACTGRSAGFAPRRTRLTYSAARLNTSEVFTP